MTRQTKVHFIESARVDYILPYVLRDHPNGNVGRYREFM